MIYYRPVLSMYVQTTNNYCTFYSIPLWACSIVFQLLNVNGREKPSSVFKLYIIFILSSIERFYNLQYYFCRMVCTLMDFVHTASGKKHYITFPLYSLVTQMGSHMKKAIFEEQTAKALKNWQKAAKQRKKQRSHGGTDGGNYSSSVMSGENTPSPSQGSSSPLYLLHKFRQNQIDLESAVSSPSRSNYNYQSETELSEMEMEMEIETPEHRRQHDNLRRTLETDRADDFSFVKP
ncbi:hypothetical protein EZV62_013812 [Acer yangbiense]|uniref:MLO-like protein n=1 Tax=Acer yangbiense TaxID=1000413 RepID=A0A5C7HQZ3_9ROSI|nr:hypothetical protein EZV62_013812 [Acer yangbiense]